MSVDFYMKDWVYVIFGRGDVEIEYCYEDWFFGKDWFFSGLYGEDVFEVFWIFCW